MRKKKNLASDEPVMFKKRSQNTRPQSEIMCSKELGGVAQVNAHLFSQLQPGHFYGFSHLLHSGSEGFKVRAIFYIRHITSLDYVLLFIGCAGNDVITTCEPTGAYLNYWEWKKIFEIAILKSEKGIQKFIVSLFLKEQVSIF